MARRKAQGQAPKPPAKGKGAAMLWLVGLGLVVGWCSAGGNGSHRSAERSTAPATSPVTYTAPAPRSAPENPPSQPWTAYRTPESPKAIPAEPPQASRTAAAQPATGDPYEEPAATSETRYASSRVNVRAQPSGSARIVGKLETGEPVQAGEERSGWRKVSSGGTEGWVSSRYLLDSLPVVTAPTITPSTTARRIAQEAEEDDSGGGFEPIRAPYVGRCDCPYDEMRNGRSCGGRSAYSRPGGRKPKCYR